MGKVFISYSRKDANEVGDLVKFIEKLDYSVWTDKNLTGGQVWWDGILGEIRQCDTFVMAVSQSSLDSEACTKELSYAIALKRLILPISVAPGVSDNLIPQSFGNLQRIHFVDRTPEESATISTALKKSLDRVPLPSPLPPTPKMPIPELNRLANWVGSSEELSNDSQSTLLRDLKNALKVDATRPDTLALLKKFSERRETARSIATRIHVLHFRYTFPWIRSSLAALLTIAIALYFSLNPERLSSIKEFLSRSSMGALEFSEIPGGEFRMGSEDGSLDEGPAHAVNIKPFEIGKTEVTVEQYLAFAKATEKNQPNNPDNASHPATNVSWDDARDYAKWLGIRINNSCRLPTEAEWEYAARAGSSKRFGIPLKTGGSSSLVGSKLANCSDCGGNSDGKSAPVAGFPPNAWGLHDMHGNVWEWVEDCWHKNYSNAPSDGQAWLQSEDGDCSNRTIRGGSFGNTQADVHSAVRDKYELEARRDFIGFRVVCSSEK